MVQTVLVSVKIEVKKVEYQWTVTTRSLSEISHARLNLIFRAIFKQSDGKHDKKYVFSRTM